MYSQSPSAITKHLQRKRYIANLFSWRYDGSLDKNKRKWEETKNASAACRFIRLRRNNARGTPSVFISHGVKSSALIWQLYLMPREDDASDIFAANISRFHLQSADVIKVKYIREIHNYHRSFIASFVAFQRRPNFSQISRIKSSTLQYLTAPQARL